MNLYPTNFTPDKFEISELFEIAGKETTSASLKVGVASFKDDERHPQEGMSVHEQDEISIILEGKFLLETREGKCKCRAGDVIHIPAGEEHASTAYDNGKVFYILFS